MTDEFTFEEREAYWLEESEKLKVGDRIELRGPSKNFPSLDDTNEAPVEPRYSWEPVTIVKILDRAPAGHLMFGVSRVDGTVRIWVPIMPWRHFSH
jgi:hypothetical protein